jgi:hypothetical protein
MANNAPVVTPIDKTVFINSFFSASELFSVFDADGDTITRYRFMDFNAEATSGYFELNGSPRFNGSVTEITAANLNNLVYIGGGSVGYERIRIQAFDGTAWSDPSVVAFAYTVRQNLTKPEVSVTPVSVLANEYAVAATFISATDPDGYPITKYMIRDRNIDNSYFQLGGQVFASGQYFVIDAPDLENLVYYAFGRSQERIDAFAYDGAQWSDFSSAVVTTIFNANRPVVQFNTAVVPQRESISVVDKILATDADGNSIKRVRFYDTSSHGFSGYLTRNGVELEAKQWHEVLYTRLDEIRYTGADRLFNEQIRVKVYDGRYWSPVQTLAFETVTRPKLGVEQNVVDSQLETFELGDLIYQTDDGPQLQFYEIVDTNSIATSGTLREDGFRRAANVIHTVSPVALANDWTFETGSYEDRALDEVYARAYNGTFYSDWKRFNFRTEPEYINALYGGISWVDVKQQGIIIPNRPVQITYSFMQQFPDYETGEAVDEPTNDPPRPFFSFLNHQRVAARQIFRQVESFANVEFVEVADTSIQPLTGYRGGDIRLGNYTLEFPTSSAAAFAFFPGLLPESGDMWFNSRNMDIFTPEEWTIGGFSYTIFEHELGHVMGLMHPFDVPGSPDNRPVLPFSTDNEVYTVMSYSGHPSGIAAGSYSLYDVINLQTMYGANTDFASGDNLYDIAGFFEGDPTRAWCIWDTGGEDTISAAGSLINADVDLRSGSVSSIGNTFENLSIAFGVEIENLIGSQNNDTLTGNELVNNITGGLGNDYIRALGGDDMVSGEGGNDTYEWGIADGSDIINENRGAGVDTLLISNFPTVNSFSDDLSFRLSGRDLIVDLTVDRGLSQGTVTIKDQKWGAFQLETLEIGGVRVDLTNVFAQASSTNQRFRVLTDSSDYGFLTVPI